MNENFSARAGHTSEVTRAHSTRLLRSNVVVRPAGLELTLHTSRRSPSPSVSRACRPELRKAVAVGTARSSRAALVKLSGGALLNTAPRCANLSRVRQRKHAPEFIVLLCGKAIKKERMKERKERIRERGHLLRR